MKNLHVIALGIILAVGVAVGSASGKRHRVGSKVGLKDYFPSIQQALNIAQPGDTVLIEEAQTYPHRLRPARCLSHNNQGQKGQMQIRD